MSRPPLDSARQGRLRAAFFDRFGGEQGFHQCCSALEIVLDGAAACLGEAGIKLPAAAAPALLAAVGPALGLFKHNVNLLLAPHNVAVLEEAQQNPEAPVPMMMMQWAPPTQGRDRPAQQRMVLAQQQAAANPAAPTAAAAARMALEAAGYAVGSGQPSGGSAAGPPGEQPAGPPSGNEGELPAGTPSGSAGDEAFCVAEVELDEAEAEAEGSAAEEAAAEAAAPAHPPPATAPARQKRTQVMRAAELACSQLQAAVEQGAGPSQLAQALAASLQQVVELCSTCGNQVWALADIQAPAALPLPQAPAFTAAAIRDQANPSDLLIYEFSGAAWDPAALSLLSTEMRSVLRRAAGIHHRLMALHVCLTTVVPGITTARALACSGGSLLLRNVASEGAGSYLAGGCPAARRRCSALGGGRQGVSVLVGPHPAVAASSVRLARLGDSLEAQGVAVLISLMLQSMSPSQGPRSDEAQHKQLEAAAGYSRRFCGMSGLEGWADASSRLLALAEARSRGKELRIGTSRGPRTAPVFLPRRKCQRPGCDGSGHAGEIAQQPGTTRCYCLHSTLCQQWAAQARHADQVAAAAAAGAPPPELRCCQRPGCGNSGPPTVVCQETRSGVCYCQRDTRCRKWAAWQGHFAAVAAAAAGAPPPELRRCSRPGCGACGPPNVVRRLGDSDVFYCAVTKCQTWAVEAAAAAAAAAAVAAGAPPPELRHCQRPGCSGSGPASVVSQAAETGVYYCLNNRLCQIWAAEVRHEAAAAAAVAAGEPEPELRHCQRPGCDGKGTVNKIAKQQGTGIMYCNTSRVCKQWAFAQMELAALTAGERPPQFKCSKCGKQGVRGVISQCKKTKKYYCQGQGTCYKYAKL